MRTESGGRQALSVAYGLAKTILNVALFAAAALALYVAVSVWLVVKDLPDLSTLGTYAQGDPIQVFDRYDKLVCSFRGDENRHLVTIDQVSEPMQLAVLAAEDHNFYKHDGINVPSIARAMLANLHAGRVVEGGSTITQQLVKNLFFEKPRRNLERKLAEAVLALELERLYPKKKILEMYLNEAFFGNGAYGIEQAARYYFGRSASRLDVAESAFLAGLIKSPSRLGSPANRQLAMDEQKAVIEKMVRYGFISERRANFARAEKLRFVEKLDAPNVQRMEKYPFYVSYVLDLVRQRYTPGEIRRYGLKIYTALDPTVQEMAERALSRGIGRSRAGVTQGALVTVSVKDGSMVALVGGVGDYETHQFNRATHPHTTGSSFKPFVYLAALDDQILTPESTVDDTALTVREAGAPEWRPNNYDRRFLGAMTMRDALTYSRNVCAVRVAQQVGIQRVVEMARRAGITEKLDPNLSLALGSSAVSPMEMAGAYATIARGGLLIRPWVLRRVEDRRGRVIQVFDQPVSRAFSPEAAVQMSDMLREVVLRGTGQGARLSQCFAAGKTGTSDQARDLWFIGFTPDLVTAVWGGNDDNSPVAGSHVTGGTVMAGIWRDYMGGIYDNRELYRRGLIAHDRSVQKQASGERAAPVVRRPAAPPALRTDPGNGSNRATAAGGQQSPVVPVRPASGVVLQPQQAVIDTSAPQVPRLPRSDPDRLKF